MIDTSLVLLPGLDGTEIPFGPLLRHLPPWVHPAVINYPNVGANSYEELLEWVDKKTTHLSNFAILGSSFGGPLALMLQARHPSRVSAVALCASFVTPPRPRLVPFRWFARTPVIGTVRAVRRLRYVIPGFASDELRRAKAALWRRVGARVLAARSRAVLTVDARSLLRDCRAPLLYLWYTRDEGVPRSCLNEVTAIAPHAHVTEVEGTHHGLFMNPMASAACIADFLSLSLSVRDTGEAEATFRLRHQPGAEGNRH